MVEGIEGVGEAVTGGMAARAVEPEAGERAAGEGACLNCGTALIGDYCHCCGQKGHVHRTLTAWWHDLAHGVLHLDGKIWRTLPLLAWKPGELTRRYAEGERARFVSPMALFLFSVFLMFAVFSFLGGPLDVGNVGGPDQIPQEQRAELEREHRQDRAEKVAELEALRAQRGQLADAARATGEIDRKISGIEREIALEDRIFREALDLVDAGDRGEAAAEAPEEAQSNEINLTFDSGSPSVDGWFESAYGKAKTNPSLLIYKVQNNAYKFSWALIPISVPFVWLLFLHRRRYREYRGYDHTVFVTYSIAFMSLGLIALSILNALGLGGAWVWPAIFLVPPIHIFRQLRGAYRLSRWSALWRTVLIVNFAFVAGGLFFTLLLMLGLLG